MFLLVGFGGVASLGFVVVAELEGALLGKAHPSGQRLGDAAVQFGDLLVVVDSQAAVQLIQMLLCQIDELGKDDSGGGGSGVEIAVLDGGVDAGVGALLQPFQHGKQPSKQIGQVVGLFIELHGQSLLHG